MRSTGQCHISTSPLLTRSVMKKYLKFVCRVRFPLGAWQFDLSLIALSFYWLSNMIIPFASCSRRMCLVHNICGIMLSTNITSVSADIFVFIHCLWELQCTTPFTRVVTAAIWILVSGCTANESLAHHWVALRDSALSISGMMIVDLNYHNDITNFFQSSSFGSFTPLDR